MEYLFLALLTLGTGLGSAYIVYMIVKPKAEQLVSRYSNTIPGRIKKELNSFFKEATENLDLGAIGGALGGGEGADKTFGAVAGLLGGGSGGIGELLGLLSKLGGKDKEGEGSSGW